MSNAWLTGWARLDTIAAQALQAQQPAFCQAITELYAASQARKIPNITPATALWLQAVILAKQSKRILEIGTANGVSCLQMGLAARSYGGVIDTYEISTLSYAEAQQNISQFGMHDCIHSYCGDALIELPMRGGQFDLIFIDGQKKYSLEFLRLVSPYASAEALIVIDDVHKWAHKMTPLYVFLTQSQHPYVLHQTDTDDALMLTVPIQFTL